MMGHMFTCALARCLGRCEPTLGASFGSRAYPEHVSEADGAASVRGAHPAVEDDVTQLHHVGDHLQLSLPAALSRLTALQRPAIVGGGGRTRHGDRQTKSLCMFAKMIKYAVHVSRAVTV